MAVIFHDTFVEASEITLANHTPDTVGTSWWVLFDSLTVADIVVKPTGDTGTSDVAGPDTSDNGRGRAYGINPAPSTADVELEFDLYESDWSRTNTYMRGAFARNQGGDEMYAVLILPNGHSDPSVQLFRIDSASRYTLLGSYDATLVNGTVIRFECYDAAKKVYVNGVERISSTDNTLTGTGDAGLFWGDWDGMIGGSGHPDRRSEIGYFKVTEAGAPPPVSLEGVGAGTSSPVAQLTVSGGAVVLEGQADGAATGSAALSVDLPIVSLFGSSSGVGTAAANISVDLNLEVPPRPCLVFEIDNSSPGTETAEWYALTDDVLEIQADTGISGNEFVADVGVMTVLLDNHHRRYSPDNRGYYTGSLRLGARVRLRETTVGVLFLGTISYIDPMPGRFGEQTVLLTCEDRIGVLAREDLSLPAFGEFGTGTLVRTVIANAFKTGLARTAVSFVGAPLAGDSIRIAERDYTFVATTPAAEGEVRRGSADVAARNLAAAINLDVSLQSQYFTGQTPNKYVSAVYTPRTSLGDQHITVATNDASYGTCSVQTDRDLIVEVGGVYAQAFTSNVYGHLEEAAVAVRFFGGMPAPGTEIPDMGLELWTDDRGQPGKLITVLDRLTAITTPIQQGVNLDTWLVFQPPEVVECRPGETYWLVIVPKRFIRQPDAISAGLYHQGDHLVGWRGYSTSSTPTLYRSHPADPWETRWDGVGLGMEVSITEYTLPRVELYAQGHGGWGNLLLFSTLQGSSFQTPPFSGGAYPTFATAPWVAGVIQLFSPYSRESNALSIIRGLVQAEYGKFYCRPDGTLTFLGRTFFSLQSNWEATDELTDLVDAVVSYSPEQISNRVVAEYTPTRLKSVGVLAEAPSVIMVPGTGGEEFNPSTRWNVAGADEQTNPVNTRSITLRYIEPESKARLAAESVITPVRGTDYTVSDNIVEEDGYDYTYSGNLIVSVAPGSGGVVCTFTNTALGPLYVFNFRVRGVGIEFLEPLEVIREDGPSQQLYGVYEKRIRLPYPERGSTELSAASIAEFILSRERIPNARIEQATRYAVVPSDLSIVHGSILKVDEDYLNLHARTLVEGIRLAAYPNDEEAAYPIVSYRLSQLGLTTYWLLGVTNFSNLDRSTRLGL